MSSDSNPEERGAQHGGLEGQLQRLEEIVKQLEGEEISLERSLALFEEGVALAREIRRGLEESRLRVRQVLGLDEEPQPFDWEGETRS